MTTDHEASEALARFEDAGAVEHPAQAAAVLRPDVHLLAHALAVAERLVRVRQRVFERVAVQSQRMPEPGLARRRVLGGPAGKLLHRAAPRHDVAVERVQEDRDGCVFEYQAELALARAQQLLGLLHRRQVEHEPVSYTHLTLPTTERV